jgi:hypothetical protein
MSSSLKSALNANSTKPTSVSAVKNDKLLSSSSNSNSSSSSSSSKRTITKRPNSLLTDSKAFEYNNNCTVSNSTSQASLYFTKNSLSSPATENPTDSVFTMYQKSNKNSIAALSVADVKFIDETATTSAAVNINRNNSNNQKSYSNKNSNSTNKYSSPELTPTTNLFPIFSQLESNIKNTQREQLAVTNKINSPNKPSKNSKKALQDKLSSLPREFSDSSVSSSSEESPETTATLADINNNSITTVFQKTQTNYKITKNSQVQSSKLQQINYNSHAASVATTVLSPNNNTFADRKSDRNNQKCLYSLQKSSTPRYDLAEENNTSRETANSLEALYEPNLDKNNRDDDNDNNENTINKYATFPRKTTIANKSNSVSNKQVWEKRKAGDNIPKTTINTPKATIQSLKRPSRSETCHYTPEISRLKIKFTKTPQATNHALSASSSTSVNPAKQPLISSFKPYQSHSRNSSLESGVTILKFKGDYSNSNHQRVATPTGTLDSALSGSHNVIFQDKDDDDGKHSRNLIVFFGLICFIIGLVLVFLMLLRRKNS